MAKKKDNRTQIEKDFVNALNEIENGFTNLECVVDDLKDLRLDDNIPGKIQDKAEDLAEDIKDIAEELNNDNRFVETTDILKRINKLKKYLP